MKSWTEPIGLKYMESAENFLTLAQSQSDLTTFTPTDTTDSGSRNSYRNNLIQFRSEYYRVVKQYVGATASSGLPSQMSLTGFCGRVFAVSNSSIGIGGVSLDTWVKSSIFIPAMRWIPEQSIVENTHLTITSDPVCRVRLEDGSAMSKRLLRELWTKHPPTNACPRNCIYVGFWWM